MKKAKVVCLDTCGGPEKMRVETVDLPAPSAGEVTVRQTAVGINFLDTMQRKGLIPLPLPTGLGFEAAGFVEEIGEGVEGFAAGDRVAYMNAGVGAYADLRNVPASKLVKIPDAVSDEAAATLFFKGLTAQYLLRATHSVKPGDRLLIHSAAGGVGQILTRWATSLGASVVGTVGSAAKVKAGMDAGCVAVVDYSQDDWIEGALAGNGGQKFDVVYDSVGAAVFLASMDCLKPFGLHVYYGASSGPAPAIEPDLLNRKGCLFMTRPSVFPHNADPARFRQNAADLFEAITLGHVSVPVAARYQLEDVGLAHADMESRKTVGALVLLP